MLPLQEDWNRAEDLDNETISITMLFTFKLYHLFRYRYNRIHRLFMVYKVA